MSDHDATVGARPSLPIYDHVDEIVKTIRDHQVVVVEGPTGSGKTTQLPRILLHAGLVPGMIGVTQPRRIAATSVASRIAVEEGVELGEEVGYAIRFDDKSGPKTQIKVMTDGILLMEARTDPLFSAYDIIMVDEAHERTLNIDFTLGLLHRALERRRDLKVIVSSATLKPEVFQRYFGDVVGEVPMLSIEARVFPVEIAHAAPRSGRPDDVVEAAATAVMGIHKRGAPGHVLVFLSGEGMIRSTEEELLRRDKSGRMQILPLFGRLPREEQERVFDDFGDRRKVVLATNIAETSLTIPDVCFVVDSGLAKVPRMQAGTGIQVLAEEGISQASAAQRSGRAGRTAPGKTVRLYSPRDLAMRAEFVDEEISRLDLSDVFLRLIDHGVERVQDFPFPTRPPKSKVRAALRKLEVLGAITPDQKLTEVGRRMVPFPLSPELARMVVEAGDHFPNVLDEVLVVGAFLSGRRPYLFPQDEEAYARAVHKELARREGDAVTDVHTYRLYQKALDKEAFCGRNYLDPDIMAFVEKTHDQLREIARNVLGTEIGSGGPNMSINRAVAAGFADNILMSRGRALVGPGDAKISLHPSSSLFGTWPKFVVAAEIMVSTRAYAHKASVIKPEWIPELNPELARRWRIRGEGRRREQGEAVAEAPDALFLRGVQLPLSIRRGEVRVDIPLTVIPRLQGVGLDELPPGASDWKSRISTGRHHFAQGLPLGVLLELLPVLPLPVAGSPIPQDVPEGAMLELDRNLHTLERFLDRLLLPSIPSRGRRAGWLMLASSGDGVFWYEVNSDILEAADTTLASLREVSASLPPSDGIQDVIEGQYNRIEPIHTAIQGILSQSGDRRRSRSRTRSPGSGNQGKKGPGDRGFRGGGGRKKGRRRKR